MNKEEQKNKLQTTIWKKEKELEIETDYWNEVVMSIYKEDVWDYLLYLHFLRYELRKMEVELYELKNPALEVIKRPDIEEDPYYDKKMEGV